VILCVSPGFVKAPSSPLGPVAVTSSLGAEWIVMPGSFIKSVKERPVPILLNAQSHFFRRWWTMLSTPLRRMGNVPSFPEISDH
jgi:hypothetical protein